MATKRARVAMHPLKVVPDQLVMMAAQAESLRRKKKIRRARFGARTGASLGMGTVLVLLVTGLFALLFGGVVRFPSEPPF